MDFMSIEVAAQKFLFHSEPGPSLTEVDELASVTEQDVGMARARAVTKVPFFHNHFA